MEKRLQSYELYRRFFQQFKKLNRGVLCKELTGYTLSNPEEYEKAKNENIFRKKCDNYVRNAITILLELTEPKNT
jgi:hypothetical protein